MDAHLNEWGVPDWQDADSYKDMAFNLNQWRWQFLRRRADIREEFDRKCAREYERLLARFQRNPEAFGNRQPVGPDKPGFWVTTRLIHTKPEKLPNPRISDQPNDAISWSDRTDAWVQYGGEEPPDSILRFDFDLTKPIEAQLKTARDTLREFQLHEAGRLIQTRRHQEKWPLYLRVLDARSAGASWSEVATVLTHSAATEKNASDVHKQATGLCFNFPI